MHLGQDVPSLPVDTSGTSYTTGTTVDTTVDLVASSMATPDQTTAWYNILGQFDQKEQEFNSAYADLLAQADQMSTAAPDIQAEYQKLVTRAQTITTNLTRMKTALADVRSALSGAWTAVSGAWSGAESTVKGWLGLSGGDGLGFLPLIPIAIVSAALVAVAYFLNDYAQFRGKMTVYQNAIAAGATPAQAAASAATLSSSPITAKIGNMALIAGLAIAAFIFLPPLLKRLSKT